MGGVAGGAGAGAGVSELDLESEDRAGAIAGATAGGLALGAVVGLVVGRFLCEPPPPPPPPPPAPPAEAPPPPAGARIASLAGPHFAFDEATLTAEGRERVEEAAKFLREHPDLRVSVDGYTDAIGSDAYNLRLSERRARTVRDHLVEQGIAESRIQVRGLGKARPVADNRTPEGRAQNRRVEIVVR
jgi:OOP family OmpA-OmpF porin